MAVKKLEAEVPYCTVCLVAGALTCHLFVLLGNLGTARMLHNLGRSTGGWSNVGISLGDALYRELDPAMGNTSAALTTTLGVITELQEGIDTALLLAGTTTDTALADFNGSVSDLPAFREHLTVQLHNFTDRALAQVGELVDRFLELIRPALDQITVWLSKFSDSIMTALEQFGTTIDRAQKLIDQLLSRLSTTAGLNEDDMVYNTYTLFDTNQAGVVTVEDLRNVGDLYDIPALVGSKADDMLAMYDENGDGALSESEYVLLTRDQTTPNIMSLVLRAFARKLGTISGNLGAARMRDEVARSVVDYFSLMCIKNHTKLSWVSQALTNGSVPIMFTADVLKNLAMLVDDPTMTADIGLLTVNEMVRLNATAVVEAVELLADPEFWHSEGFDPADEPVTVERVLTWVINTSDGRQALREASGDDDGALGSDVDEGLPAAAAEVVRSRSDEYVAEHASANSDDVAPAGSTADMLDGALLGGVSARGQEDPRAREAQRSGVQALPETLLFAAHLSSNSSGTSTRFLQDCMDYTGESSGAVETFANDINGMIKKVTNFLNVMETYATPTGVDRLIDQARNFTASAAGDVNMVLDHRVDLAISDMECRLTDTTCPPRPEAPDYAVTLSGVFTFVTGLLYEIKSILPAVIEDLKFARRGVSAVSQQLSQVMTTLGGTAPPIFTLVSRLYRIAWVAYFVLFGLLTAAILFYGFWASGFCGGPKPDVDCEYVPPRTIMERCGVCCAACTACLRGCHDSHLCFWSVLILLQIIGLLIFVVAILICVLAGLQAFAAAGCSQIYILGDNTICTTSINVLRTFLDTFWSGTSIQHAAGMPISEVCGSENLMTCQLIKRALGTALIMEIIGSFLAAVLSFQMVINSACMHERARWYKMFDEANQRSSVGAHDMVPPTMRGS